MSGSMEGNAVSFKGGVFSPYLTTRLPAWAGVRQNVMGSNVDGRPVAPANSATLTYATVGSSVDTAAAAAASAAKAPAESKQPAAPAQPTQPTKPAAPAGVKGDKA